MKKIASFLLSIVVLLSITAGIDFSSYAGERWLWPVASSTNMSQGYSSAHDGLDITGSHNCSVRATMSGTVVYSHYGDLPNAYYGGGNFVVIKHSNGYFSHYAHLNSRSVSQGQTVKQGQEIGKMGSTGNSTGTHLHFAIATNQYGAGGRINNNPGAISYIYSISGASVSISFSEQSSNSVTNNSAGIHFVTNNPNGATITKFGIRIRKSGTNGWTELIENQTFSMTYTKPYTNYVVGSGKELNYTLTPGTTYEWQPLVVVNGSKIYDSKTSSFKTTGTSPTAKPGTVSLNLLTTTAYGFKVGWNKVSNASGYQIQYSTNSDFSGSASLYVGSGTTSQSITGRACGTKYYVRVRTYSTLADGSRVWGDWSNSKSVTTDAKPKATTMNVAPTVNGFKVSWSKVAETTGYQIEYSTRSDFKGSALVYGGATNTLSKTVTGRAAGTKYYVRVRTYKTLADGTRVWGNWSQAKAVTTNVAQATVKSVSGVSKGFTTSWNKIGGVTGYQIQYSTRKDFKGAATVYAGDKNATAKTITGRAKNTTYYVRVRGYKNNGNGNYVWGNWSAYKTVKTK